MNTKRSKSCWVDAAHNYRVGIFSVMWSEHARTNRPACMKRLPTRSRLVGRGRARECGASSTSATDGAWRLQDRVPQSILRSSSAFRARPRAWAHLARYFPPWARGLGVMDSCGLDRSKLVWSGRLRPPAARTLASTSARTFTRINRCSRAGSGIASYGNCFGVANLGGETS